VHPWSIEHFETSLNLDLSRLRALRRQLAAWLEQMSVSEAIRDDVILATHEAAANAIEHAELGSEVTVKGVHDEGSVLVIVTNSGVWKRPRSTDELRGRGLALMQALMSEVEIKARHHRTVLRMRKDLASAPARR
jgi:anti-sigma regulatory factor (Ser/Thr protein kinase)